MSTTDKLLDLQEPKRLYLVREDNDGGRYVVVYEDEKRGRAGISPAPIVPLRDVVNGMFTHIEQNAEFWLELALDIAANPPLPTKGDRVTLITPNYYAYTAYVEEQGSGFGGDRFDVEMDSGIKFWSANVWSRGTVPYWARKHIKPSGTVKGLRS